MKRCRMTSVVACAAFFAVGAITLAAHAAAQFSNASAAGSVPSKATVTAAVQGAGDVYVEYAHAKATYATVKDRYVADGLIAMWDGDDNLGTGVHDASATTWVDLTGRHAAMTFTNANPTVGANFYDVSRGGGFIKDAADIATALNAEACTVEIVCNPVSLVDDGTLFACVDKDGRRMGWVRSGNGSVNGVVASMEYKHNAFYTPYSNYDMTTNTVRSYTFTYASDACRVYKNGSPVVGTSAVNMGMSGDTASAYFSVGQRTSKNGQSVPKANMKVYSVRVYNRILSADEIAANHAQDVLRFFEDVPTVNLDTPGKTVVATNFLGTVKAPVTNAKDFYETDGLIAMWDGEDNQGTGAHDASATTWVDLAGRHAAMTFTNATPTVGANFYAMNNGGGFITDAADIATAINAEACTIEIVCNPIARVDDGSLFACVDGSGNRMLWARSGNGKVNGVIASVDYKDTTSHAPYQTYDMVTNSIRSYTFVCSSDACRVYRNGASEPGTNAVNHHVSGNHETAWFSIWQRTSKGGQSVAKANMKVYSVRVYNRILSAAEIAANHAVDELRFFGASTVLPLGSSPVIQADGTMTAVRDGVATFPLTGLRPDVTDYTARLFSSGSAPGASFNFSTGSEREGSAWFEYLDSNPELNAYKLPIGGGNIDLNFVPGNRVPVVKTKYQMLANNNGRYAFGAYSVTLSSGTAAGIFENDGHNQYRYRVGTSAYFADTNVVNLTGVHELDMNGPDGTFLNGSLLNAELSGKTDACTVPWLAFARRIFDGSGTYTEFSNVRMWYFKLWANGTLIHDLVPARRYGRVVCMFDRAGSRFYTNTGTRNFLPGPTLPAPQLTDVALTGNRLVATLTREGTAASAVRVAYGADYGDAEPSAWAHVETLPGGFAEGATSLAVSVSGIDRASVKYVRFFSYEDGWSNTVFVPDAATRNGTMVIFR